MSAAIVAVGVVLYAIYALPLPQSLGDAALRPSLIAEHAIGIALDALPCG
ncbi:MAG: hypothetical protein P8R42_27255 [Candidatus Binatia bacterium]|nr:hypothetical protein [Candidatus Binatia bacterium]